MKTILKLVLLAVLGVSSLSAMDYNNGEVVKKDGKVQAWDEDKNKFVSIEEFWQSYAKKNGGITWGQSSKYPPYNDVKEYDLFMVEIGDKTCLMEFYHTRWRRANDVRRWDDAFNNYSACPIVFE